MITLGSHRQAIAPPLPNRKEDPASDVRQFFQALTDPLQMAGFGVGMTAFRLGKLGANWLYPSRWAPAVAGLGTEALAWVGTRRLGRHLFFREDSDPWQGFGREVLAMGLSLGLLRGAGFLAEEAFWLKQGLVPAVRPFFQWTPGLKRLHHVFHQGGMFAGILAGEALHGPLGLADPRAGDHLLRDALTGLVHFNAAGLLTQRLLGPRFFLLQHALELPTEPRHPALSNSTHWVPAASGPSTLFRPWVAMSSKDKITPFPQERIVRPQNVSDRKPVSPDQTLAEVENLTVQGQANLNRIFLLLSHILDQGELHRRRMELNRQISDPEEGSSRPLRLSLTRLREEIKIASETRDALIGYALLATQLGRRDLLAFLGIRQRYQTLFRTEAQLQKILDDLAAAAPGQEGQVISQRQGILTRMAEDLSGKIRGEDSSPGGAYQGILGALFGTSIKEVFRPPVSKGDFLLGGSSRRFDLQVLDKFLIEFRLAPPDLNLNEMLFSRVSQDGINTSILRLFFSNENYLEGWFGLVPPLMIARYGANYPQVRAKFLALETQLPENFRAWSAVALWFLCQAVKRPGNPEGWWTELPRAVQEMQPLVQGVPVVRALASAKRFFLKDLKKAFLPLGPAAVVPYSMVAFLRHYDSPAKALALARRAPQDLREEVLTFTGALLGAYHGAAIFNHALVEDLTGRWDYSQMKLLKEPLEIYEKRLAELRKFWVPDETADKIVALDRPGRVVRAASRRMDIAAKLTTIREEAQRDIQTLVELQGSLISRAYQTGVTRWEWEFHRDNLRRVETNIQAWLRELNGLDMTSEGVKPLRSGLRAQMPHGVRKKLQGQLQETLRVIQCLAVEREKITVSAGPLHFNLPQYRRFQVLLAEIPSFDGLRVLLVGDPKRRRPLRESDFKDLFEAGLHDTSQFLPLYKDAPGFAAKSPWGQVRTLVKNFSGRNLSTVSLPEILEVFYRQIDWKARRVPSFDALAPLVIPAYLEIFQENTLQAYRDLEGLSLNKTPEILEALRGMAYFSLRMLEGISPDGQLAREFRDSFVHRYGPRGLAPSPLGIRMDELNYTLKRGLSLESLTESWIRTRMPVDKVAAAFVLTMRNPNNPIRALKEVDTWPVIRVAEDNHGLRRATALLSHASYLGRQNKGD